jgi:hypothetical protein
MNPAILSTGNSQDFSSKKDANDQVVCFTNIGPKQQRKRLVFGLVVFAVGIALAALLILIDANAWWRVGLFFPFAAAGIGYFQARDKT